MTLSLALRGRTSGPIHQGLSERTYHLDRPVHPGALVDWNNPTRRQLAAMPPSIREQAQAIIAERLEELHEAGLASLAVAPAGPAREVAR